MLMVVWHAWQGASAFGSRDARQLAEVGNERGPESMPDKMHHKIMLLGRILNSSSLLSLPTTMPGWGNRLSLASWRSLRVLLPELPR